MTSASPSSCPDVPFGVALGRWRVGYLVMLLPALGCDEAGTAAQAREATAVSAPPRQARPPEVGVAHGSATASAVAPVVSPRSSAPRGCRLMSASGEVSQAAGQPIHPGAMLTGSQLLELGVGAKVHVKHVESGREWTVEGPARLVPCAGGEEEIFLGQGTLRTELGAGVRPGAQVLIGTPFGSVGYADARAELVVTERELRLVANAGEAWLTPADPAVPPMRVSGNKPLRRSERERLAAAPALASCARAATESENQAKALLLPSNQALGERASAHVRERQRARSLCASAAAAVLQQTRGEELAARLRELEAHRASWRRVPSSKG